MTRVLCVGEALWDLGAKGPLARARHLEMRPGGAAVNVALALARQGISVGLAAVVGDDALGEALIARVARAGVSTALVTRALPRTGLLFVERRREGARFVGYRTADEPAPVAAGEWSAQWVLLAGLLPSEEHVRGLRAIAQMARERGARVMIDINARPRVWRGRDATAALGLLAEAEVVKASEDDLAVLGLTREAARDRMREGATLILTAGASETRAVGSFGEVVQAPRDLPAKQRRRSAADTLGAGDAFTAGVLGELLALDAGDRAGDAARWARVILRGNAEARGHIVRRRP